MPFARLIAVALVVALGACSSTSTSDAVDPKTVGPAATFDAKHEITVKLPDGAKKARVWFAMPSHDASYQSVSEVKTEASANVPWQIVHDSEGNRQLYAEVDAATKNVTITQTFRIKRHEVLVAATPEASRPYTADELAAHAAHLTPNANVVIDDKIKALAAQICGTETNPVRKARLIYDWVLGDIEYWVKDPKNKKASPVGSSTYCLEQKCGNCTDFHSLWTAIARAAQIPTRIKYGSFFKKELDGQDADQSYPCWPAFWAPNLGWVPPDGAVADIFVGDFTPADEAGAKLVRLTTAAGYNGKDQKMVDWYFGNLDNRRVLWSIGRDLTLAPKQDQGAVNALPKAYVEVDGQIAKEKEVWTRKLTYKEVK